MNPEEFLNTLINYEKIPGYKYDLEAYKKFLEKIGSPHKRLKNVILIAGTKGKGSTATIINSCLISSGFRVGLFTSPHLKNVNERIKINNQKISDREMERCIKIIKPHINLKTRIGARTFFEVLATIAYMHFVKKNVDFAIIEVGLGGRLDATNVFERHIPIITRIGFDHMNLLGNTLYKITYEKAGIIHRGNNEVITIHQRRSVEQVLKNVTHNRGNKIVFADDLHKIEIKDIGITGTDIRISGPLGEFDASLPLAGIHQIENLQIALAILYNLRNQGFEIRNSDIKMGIKNARLPGRFEILSKRPLVIYDVAHNEDSFKALDENISRFFFNKKSKPSIYIIFGCSKDKDINYAVKNIFPKAREVLIVKAKNPRAAEPIEIYNKARRFQKNLIIASSMENALDYVKNQVNCNSIILIFGSFYLYSMVK